MTKICIVCGKPFVATHGRQKICSHECSAIRFKNYQLAYRRDEKNKAKQRARYRDAKYKAQKRAFYRSHKDYFRQYYQANKDLLQERRKAHKEYFRNYYWTHRQKILIRMKMWRSIEKNRRKANQACRRWVSEQKLLSNTTRNFFQFIETVNTIQKVINEQPTSNQQQG